MTGDPLALGAFAAPSGWQFALAVAVLAVVWALLPAEAHPWLAVLLILGALVAANRDAQSYGVPGPLADLAALGSNPLGGKPS